MTLAIYSNYYHLQKQKGAIDLGTDVIKVILMDDTFTFNKDTHSTLAEVSAKELTTGNGYTQDSIVLVLDTHVQDDINDKAIATFEDVTVTASVGSIGPTVGAIIYDSSTIDDTVIGYIDFETSYTIPAGVNLELRNLVFEDKQGA